MRPIMRRYETEEDYWKIRVFLREIFLYNNRREICWQPYRWDYWRWHINENIVQFSLNAAVFLWEDRSGRLAAVLHPDGRGEAILQVHPDFQSSELDIQMLQIAETHYAVQHEGKEQLTIWVHEINHSHQELLSRRGYTRQNFQEYQRRRDMSLPILTVPLPHGYTIRALGSDDELPARSWLSWRAFHPDEPDEHYKGWEWYRNIQRAPMYRRDLDLVAVAPDGELAAFCTLWFDEFTRTASFEPVGTHPDHQRKGVGKALLTEGLLRVQRLGATLATVGSYSQSASALYASVGFTQYDLSEAWQKTW